MENSNLNPLKSPSTANDPANNNDDEDVLDSANTNAESSNTNDNPTEGLLNIDFFVVFIFFVI